MLLASSFDQSKYLKAVDLSGELKLKIKNVSVELIGNGAEKEEKLVVWFTNDRRGLVLNRTNNRTLRGAFGDDTNDWQGRVIVAYPTEAEMRGRMVPAVRVRIPPPKTQSANGQQAAQRAAADVAAAATAKRPITDDMDDEITF